MNPIKSLVPVLGAAVAFAVASPAALAQDVPSYAHPAAAPIKGRIASFDGAYSLQLRDDRGYVDTVRLRQGTLIEPTGLRLTEGMSVTIYGEPQGSAFVATEIDTPYHQSGYAYAGYGGPYYGGYYGYPYGFGGYGGFGYAPGWYGPGYFGAGFVFAPSFAFGFGFGGRGYYGGGYHGYGGVRGGYGGGFRGAYGGRR